MSACFLVFSSAMPIIPESHRVIIAILPHNVHVKSKEMRERERQNVNGREYRRGFRLAIDLDESEGENWRDRVPKDTKDDERYFNYLKRKDKPDDDLYDWYRKHANQLYLDACYILAIHYYTLCAELQPKQHLSYLNRAACYLKVFEVRTRMEKICIDLFF